MAPPSADSPTVTSLPTHNKIRSIPEIKKSVAGITQSASFPTPLVNSGSLDNYESFDVTSVIGREFPTLQLSSILDDDEKLRDLAITGIYLLSYLTINRIKLIRVSKQSVNVVLCSFEIKTSRLSNRRS